MKQLLVLFFLAISTAALAQVPQDSVIITDPEDAPNLDPLTDNNFTLISRDDGDTETIQPTTLKKYVQINVNPTPIGTVPAATGNVTFLGRFVEDPNGNYWAIDMDGDAFCFTCDTTYLADIMDVTITSPLDSSIMVYDSLNGVWINGPTISDIVAQATGGSSGFTQEEIEDFIGAMVTGNTETRITVEYTDNGASQGKLNFAVDNDLSNYDNTLSDFATNTALEDTAAAIRADFPAASTDDQNLAEVLAEGNTANAVINMNNNDITALNETFFFDLTSPSQNPSITAIHGDFYFERDGDTLFKISQTGGIEIFGNYIFPGIDGSANQVLKTDGAGNVSWASDNTGGAGTLTVEEADGSPSVTATILQVDSSDGLILTDEGAGQVQLDLSGVPVSAMGFDPLEETELDTEVKIEAQLTDVTDVFTNNDGALDDDDLSDNDTDDLTEGLSNLYFTNERAEDAAGGMFSGNTETLITATYQVADNTMDLVVENDLSQYDNTISDFATNSALQDTAAAIRNDFPVGGGSVSATRFNTLVVSNSLGTGTEDTTDLGFEFLPNLWTHDRFTTTFIPAYPDTSLAGSPGYTTVPNAQIGHLPNDGFGADRTERHGNVAYWFNYLMASASPIDTFTITYASKGGILSDSVINKYPWRDSIINVITNAVSAGATKFQYVVCGFGTNETAEAYPQNMLNLKYLLDSLGVIDDRTIFLVQTPGPESTPMVGGAIRQMADARNNWVAIPMQDLPQIDGNHFLGSSYKTAGYRAYLLAAAAAATPTDTTYTYGWGKTRHTGLGSRFSWTWWDNEVTSSFDSIQASIMLLPNSRVSASGYHLGNAIINLATTRDTVAAISYRNNVIYGVDNVPQRDTIGVFGGGNDVSKDNNLAFGFRNTVGNTGSGIFGNDRTTSRNFQYIFGRIDTESIVLGAQEFRGMDSTYTAASNGHVFQLSGGEWIIAAQNTGTDDQTLAEVLTEGNTANMDINMDGFDVTNIRELNISDSAGASDVSPFTIIKDDTTNDLEFVFDGGNAFAITGGGTVIINSAIEITGTDGTDGQVLTTDGAGNVGFEDVPAADNLGNHTATASLNMDGNEIDSISVLNLFDTNGNGTYFSAFEDASGNLIIQSSDVGTDDLTLTAGGELRLGNAPTQDNAEDEILMYDSGTGAIERRTVSSLPAGGGGSGTTLYFFGGYSTQDDTLTVDTWTDITFDNEVKKDASFNHSTVTNSQEITLDSTGVYILEYTVQWESNATARIDIYARPQIDTGGGYGDINGGAGYASGGTEPFSIGTIDKHGLSAAGIMFSATSGDKVKIQIYGDTFGSGASTDVQISEGSSITLKRIE